jgi:hypothetical protein
VPTSTLYRGRNAPEVCEQPLDLLTLAAGGGIFVVSETADTLSTPFSSRGSLDFTRDIKFAILTTLGGSDG